MKKIIHIYGMHCVACETLLEKECNNIKGCTVLSVSYKTGKLQVEVENELVEKKIYKAVKKLHYSVDKSDGQPLNRAYWIRLLIIGIIVAIFMFIMKYIDIYQYLPSSSEGAGFGVALLFGVIASISTCLAVTGGIVIGFSEYIDDTKGMGSHLRVQGLFHIGRIGGFFVLGGLLGLLGQAISISIGVTATLTILVGIVLLYMGLYMLKLVPNITKRGFHLPKSWTRSLHTKNNSVLAPIIGVLTFFIPCGFTQSMQLLAVSTGDFWTGGMIMGLFALGTLPVLLGVGLGASYIKEKKFGVFHMIVGTLVLVFGGFTIMNGYNLIGISNFNQSTMQSNLDDNASIIEDIVRTEHVHDGWQLNPREINLTAGESYELVIMPESNGIGCMSSMVIPRLGFRRPKRIIANKPIVYTIINARPGTYPVVCASMGMAMGEIVVR